MQQPFVKGDLVQLLDVRGEVHEDTLGITTGVCPRRGSLIVHWFVGAENYTGAAYQWGRITHARGAHGTTKK